MNNERTYTVIGKYIAEHNDITIKFEPNVVPNINLDKKVITIPSNLSDETIYAGLATLMHEAAHMKHTPTDMAEAVCDDATDMHILNAIEDTRIDNLNFRKLPNIKSFYEDMFKHTYEEIHKKDTSKIPLPVKTLVQCILWLNGATKYLFKDIEVDRIITQHNLIGKFREGQYHITSRNYPQVKAIVKEIRDALFPPQPTQQQPQPQDGKGDGQGGKPDGDPTPGDSTPSGDPDKQPTSGGEPTNTGDLSDMDAFGNAFGKVFKNIDKNAKPQGTLSPVSLQEQTKQKFSQLLNIKEKRVINDGHILDSDNLVSFFTGDIENLFKEDTHVHVKKSKILFLLDSSASMKQAMVDGVLRTDMLVSAVESMIKILNEVQEMEGLNVDYLVRCFDYKYHKLDKKHWKDEYLTYQGGATCIKIAFEDAQKEILEDQSIDGHKMMIIFTDGQVHDKDIKDIKQSILQHNADVRVMIIGIDSEVNGPLKKITPHNILSHDLADLEILEASMNMLS